MIRQLIQWRNLEKNALKFILIILLRLITVDEMGVDESGVHKMGVDEVGINHL